MASPYGNKLLNEMSQSARDLIEIIDLERTGVRDGNGYWVASDPLSGTVEKLGGAWRQYDQHQSATSYEEAREDGQPF